MANQILSRLVAVALPISAILLTTMPAPVLGASSVTASESRFELQVPVLYYHRLLCPPPDATIPSLYECPDQFDAQLAYLEANGWTTVTVDQLADLMADRECPPAKSFVISIDDGAVDGYDNAAPIMESHGMRGSFFVTSGPEGGARMGKISWDQLRDLIARGHAIGNHSETHMNLKVQPADVLYDQIEVAQQIFEEQLGFRPRTFAYPYGRYNDSVIAQVDASGFELAFTVHAGAREASDAPYLGKRIEVLSDDSGADVLAKMARFSDGCRPATPDLSVALSSSGPYKGDGTFAPTAWQSQTIRQPGVKFGQTYRYWLRIDNDSQTAGPFKVMPTLAGNAGMDVRYKTAGVDVTSAMTAGTYMTPALQPWMSMTIVVRITPLHAGATGDFTSVTLGAVSVTDPTRVDVARVVATF